MQHGGMLHGLPKGGVPGVMLVALPALPNPKSEGLRDLKEVLEGSKSWSSPPGCGP